MGSKINASNKHRCKIIKYLFLCTISIMCTMPCQAQIMPTIPQNTLQAAREAVINEKGPTSEVVRVGIGTQNFGTYQYKDITIFGTGDTQIYDNRLLIGNYPPNQEIKISLKK